MNLKAKAALKTAGLFVAFTGISVTVALIAQYMTLQEFSILLVLGVLGLTVYNTYRMVLSQMETDRELSEMAARYKE